MADSHKKERRRALLDSTVEFVLLIILWMMFVSLLQWNELLAGLAAAAIGAVADGVVKATDFARFRPRLSHAALILTTPWYVLTGTLAVFGELARHLAGKPPRTEFVVVPFDGGADDVESSARRALATAYTTISPNSIVIGIDRERGFLLLHSLPPSPTPWITRQLGAKA